MTIVSLLTLNFLLTPLYSQQMISSQDTSPHTIHFLTVDKDVRLEVLDWGGQGRSVILLAGGGNTAHVFDDFAPKLKANFHVYGITRRGFGASEFSTPIKEDQLDDDILAIIDSLKLDKPVLVGHSIAGAEMSSVALSRPDRIAGLVYLDAAYPYAFDNGKGPSMKEFMELRSPQPPAPSVDDLVSYTTLQKWEVQTSGLLMPEAELRYTWDSSPDGRPAKRKNSPGFSSMLTMMTSRHVDIPVPALAINAVPHVWDIWMTNSTNPEVQKEAKTFFTTIDSLAKKQATVLKESVRTVRIVEMRGMHFIFISNEADVLREIRSFIGSLK